MAASTVQSLLSAVRRRLWMGRFAAATRLAMWGTAGLMLLAAAVHFAVRPVPAGAVPLAVAALWVAMMARAGLRRPSDSACALWADRHLAGASAFATLLELRGRTPAPATEQAQRWLEIWAATRVPHSLQLLAEQRDSARLSPPFISMLICTALASLALALPDLAPSSRPELAASLAPGFADRITPDVRTPMATEVVSELAGALRSAASRRAEEEHQAGRAPAAGPGRTNDGNSTRTDQPETTLPPGERAIVRESLPGTAVDVVPMSGAATASGAGSGRDAGDSPDYRAAAGVSRVLRGTLQAQGRESSAVRLSPERQADMDQPATFDDDLSAYRVTMVRADAAPAAATPPPATEATRLTPTEATYVQAWMKSSGQHR